MRLSRRLVAAAGLVVLVTGLVSSCGSDAPPERPTSTRDAVLDRETLLPAVDQAVRAAGTAQIAVDLGPLGGPATGALRVGSSPEDSAAQLSIDPEGAAFELRWIGGRLFLDLGELTGGGFEERPTTDQNDPAAFQYGATFRQLDLSIQLPAFEAALRDVLSRGAPLELDGVRAEPYVLSLDSATVLGVDPASLTASGAPATLYLTMYVGPDHLPRRIVSTAAGVESVVDYSAWGSPADIQVPDVD